MKPFLTGLVLASALFVPATHAAKPNASNGVNPAAGRVNILFAIADDWGWPHAGAYGDPVVQTPVFDRIAKNGVLFRHAYISSPSCTPSRNAILSGQHFFRLEEGANLWSAWPPYPSYPLLLEGAGYFSGYKPKAHGPGRPGPGWKGTDPSGKRYRSFEAFLADKPADRPFCYWAGSSDPHRGYAQGKGDHRDEANTPVPPYWPDTPAVRADINDYYFEVERFDAYIGGLLEQLKRAGLYENTLVVMTGDHGWPFPRGKGNLYDAGARVPMAAQWPAGMPGGRVIEDFVSTTDLAPTFLEAAGAGIPASMTGRSLLGLLRSGKSGRVDPARDAVICGRERHTPAHPDPRHGYPARSIRTHEFLYIRNHAPDRLPAGSAKKGFRDCDGGPTKQAVLACRGDAERQRFFDWCFGPRPAEELYQVAEDPHQLRNLAGAPEQVETLRALRERLTRALREAGDPRARGETEVFLRGAYLGRGGPKKRKQPAGAKPAN